MGHWIASVRGICVPWGSYFSKWSQWQWKKHSDKTQTLRAGCSKPKLKKLPRCRPLPRGAGRPKFNQLQTVTTFTYKPSLVRIDACNFELLWDKHNGWVTDPPTHPPTHTQTGQITIYCAAASAQCKKCGHKITTSSWYCIMNGRNV